MSEDSEELLTGREGNEAAFGWTEMKSADPVPKEPEGLDLANDPAVKHLSRPAAEQEPPVEREYYGRDGEPTPERESVSAEQAGRDLASIRAAERAERERQSNADLDEALRAHEAGQPAAEQSPDQPQPEQPQLSADELQLDEGMDDDQKRAFAESKFAEADQILEEALKQPLVREKLESEFNAVRAEAKAAVERAHNLSAAVQQHYATATNNLVGEANALLGVLYPELNGLNPEQIKGALTVMAQQQPQRVQQLQTLAARAQGLVEAQARQADQAAQGQALQQNHALEQFTAAEEKRYEEATKYESPETMKQVRSQVYDITEKAYGINKQTMNALYTGQQRVDSAAFVRSAAFQLMLTDAVKYRLSKQGITQARSNPIPQVQRPGVSSGAPSDNSEYASLERTFRGKDLSAKQAADLLIAHRATRR